MGFLEILLILISGAGLLHGIFFAIYLVFNTKKVLSNVLLGLILFFMALRIGKSVMLYFGNDLEPLYIFAGLSFLLIIGPLFHWYTLAMTRPKYKLPKYYLLELLPFTLVFVMSFFVHKGWFNENNSEAIVLFASIIIFIYLHFAFYIFKSGRVVRKVKQEYPETLRTKSQTTVLQWLRVLLIGFMVIWLSYVLNIIEDTVPYIIGPVVYSIVIYFLSYSAFKLRATNSDGRIFDKGNASLFQHIDDLVRKQKLYLESDISLDRLSKLIEKSTQKTSEAINQYAKRNFNDFINYYRIQDAKQMLSGGTANKLTISSIAFDTGFSSLSSFNVAFKKFEGITPSAYKKNNSI